MTHPAFTSLDVTGLWVGKFETGYKGSTDTESAQKNENAPEKVQIKPNVNSWRSINVSNMYNTSFNYKRNLDSHMMKNTEWGAMAYLTNSKYGRGNTEVWINNSSSFITGCAGDTKSASDTANCTNPYPDINNDNRTVFQGSTTNNISGIYDTSGGAWDTLIGNYNNTAGSSNLNPSSIPIKYKDIYIETNAGSNKILGDATGETQGWNSDYADFVNSSDPWFGHGGRYANTTGAGVFGCNNNSGYASSGNTFRIVLSPTA